MAIELDHFFILTDVAAPQADLVAAMGLTEGSSNDHPGQGTSNRRFFFKNTTLEFLYVRDDAEAADGPAKGLRFRDRSVQSDASPFGLIMRKAQGDFEGPFESWKYCPDYFASDQCFDVGSNSDVLEEPLCICMPDNLPQRANLPVPENSGWALTHLKISVPVAVLSGPLNKIAQCQNITVEPNKPHCLELTFNEGAEGQRRVFEPDIPLIVNT